jgi:nitrous oxidase accessory protein
MSTLYKRILALTLCCIIVLSVLTVWAVTNTQKTIQKTTPNLSGTSSNISSKNDNSLPNNSVQNNSMPNSKASIVVPDDYPNISSAVEHAQNGDVIFVKPGTYVESVTVDKPLTLQGQNTQTIVDGNNIGPSFLVTSDNVTITGFTIRNVENAPPPSNSLGQLAGIHLLTVHGSLVFNNTVENCGKGVWVYGGSDNQITNNTFSGNNYGVLLDSSSNNVVADNSAFGGWSGILLESSEGNTLRNNDVFNNAANFGVTGENPAFYRNNVDSSNRVDGKKVYYLISQSNLVIDSATYPDLGALVLVNSKNVTVENLEVANTYGGIHITNAIATTVTNNTVSNTTSGAIWLQFSSNCTVSNNNLTPNGNYGIQIESSNSVDVNKNYIEQADTNFISLENTSSCTVTGNSLGDPFDNGIPKSIYLDFSNYTTIEDSNDNTIANNQFATERSYYGLTLFQSFGNQITDNTIYNFSTGLQLSNAENNLIARNVVTSKMHAAEIFMFNNNTFDSNQFMGATDVWDMGPNTGHAASTNTWI